MNHLQVIDESVYSFGHEFLVVCPKCSARAQVIMIKTGSNKLSEMLKAPRKVVCFNCAYTNDWKAGAISIGASVDWYFGLPLWLQTRCGDEVLWAYNQRHLEFLEHFISSKDRKFRGKQSLAMRLPLWMIKAKNRDKVLKAIHVLKTKYRSSGEY